MMDIDNKTQKSGSNSINLQADNLTIHTGPSISNIRELALEVFENNFHKLSGAAREIAEKRAKEITEQFLSELILKNSEGLVVAEDPDFQSSLFQVQKEYAKCGEKELGDILVDILIDRTKEQERTLLQIVLNESLIVAPKLNSAQLEILACCFNIFYTQSFSIKNLQDFEEYINNTILIFSDKINEKDTNYKHLEYLGCATIREGKRSLINLLKELYIGIFSKGFEMEEIGELREKIPKNNNIFIRSLHNPGLYQTCGMTDDITRERCRIYGMQEDDIDRLIAISTSRLMNNHEATTFLQQTFPKFEKFTQDFESTPFQSLELTSVGIAIAHAHSRKKVGFSADLSIWI